MTYSLFQLKPQNNTKNNKHIHMPLKQKITVSQLPTAVVRTTPQLTD